MFRIALFVNSIYALEYIKDTKYYRSDNNHLITLRRDVYIYSEKNIRPNKLQSPLNFERNFLFYKEELPYIVAQRKKYGYYREAYQKTFNSILQTFFQNTAIGYYKDYAFFINGDWNACDEIGMKLFYPVDVILDILEIINPDFVISVDDQGNEKTERYILSYLLPKDKLGTIEI